MVEVVVVLVEIREVEIVATLGRGNRLSHPLVQSRR